MSCIDESRLEGSAESEGSAIVAVYKDRMRSLCYDGALFQHVMVTLGVVPQLCVGEVICLARRCRGGTSKRNAITISQMSYG